MAVVNPNENGLGAAAGVALLESVGAVDPNEKDVVALFFVSLRCWGTTSEGEARSPSLS